MLTDSWDVVVLGAGMGGLSAGLSLAGLGRRVLVVEQHAAPGGKVRTIAVADRQVDCGPTVLTMRPIFEELFASANLNFDDHVRLHAQPLLARHAWSDGSRLDLFADSGRSSAALTEFAGPSAAAGYAKFCAYAGEILERVEKPFLRHDNPGLWRLLRRVGFAQTMALAGVDFTRTMWQALGEFFADPRLRQLFARYATYYGSSPFAAPGTLNLIANVEQRGVWTVDGGMIELVAATARALKLAGGSLMLGRRGVEVMTRGNQVCGVRLDDGSQLACRAVVFNGDPSVLTDGVLGEGVKHAVRRHRSTPSLSAMTWSMAAVPEGFPLSFHNVFFSDDYEAEFDQLFHKGRVPAKPTVYVCAQDRALGPASGPERLFCLVNAPATTQRQPDPREESRCRHNMEQTLLRCGLRIQPVTPVQAATPQDFAQNFPGTGGAIYGAATHGALAPFRRYPMTTAIPNLWLVGGAVHPGAGLPMVTLGGMWVARRIHGVLDSTSRFRPVATLGGTSTVSS